MPRTRLPAETPRSLRTLVLVDEANTSNAARPFGCNLDWLRLRDHLTSERNRDLIEMVFYIGLPPAMAEWQAERDKKNKFVHWLRSHGFLVVAKDGSPGDEGHYKANVDVLLAVDALDLVGSMHPEAVILVSGDADFASLVHPLRRRGIRVEVAAVQVTLGTALKTAASEVIDLTRLFESFEPLKV